MTIPAPAADKSKDVSTQTKSEAGDAAAAAKVKLQEDATVTGDSNKAKPTDGKAEITDATSKKPEVEETSWLVKAREEALDFLGFNGSSVAKTEAKAEAKAKPDVKGKEELHLDIPKLDYGFSANYKPEPFSLKQVGEKPEAEKPAEKSGLSWLWDKAYTGVTSAGKYVTDGISGAWDSLTSSVSAIEEGTSKFGHNETTVKSPVGEYKISNDKGELVDFSGETDKLLAKINSEGKTIENKETGVKYSFAKDGDMAIHTKELTVISDKDGHRIVTDKRTGDVLDYDKKTNEITRIEKDGTRTHYSKEEVDKTYGEWIRVVNKLADGAEDIGKKLASGEVITQGNNVTVRRANDMVTVNKPEQTMVITGLKQDGSESGVKHSIDFKTGTVTSESNGVKGEPQRLRDFLKEHPEYKIGPDGIFKFDCQRRGRDNRMHRQQMELNAGDGKAPAMIATNSETGETVRIDSPGNGKVEQVRADASGKQLGDKVLVDPSDKANAYKEVNDQGIVTAKVDTSKPDAAFTFNDDQGNNILGVTDRNAVIGYGDDAIGISSDDRVYDSHGTLMHDGSTGASAQAQAAATEAVASASAASQAASLASSLVQSAMSNPGSMDVGYLTSILGSAYNAAASAMAQSITSFSAVGMVAANSAMAMVASQLGQVGRVQAERSNLYAMGVPDGSLVNDALKLSLSGGYTPGQAIDWARKERDTTVT